MAHPNIVLVSAPTPAGESFVKLLQTRNVPFAVIVNNAAERKRMSIIGADRIVEVNTAKEETWIVPEVEVGKVFLFESSLALICRYIQICRSWTTEPIYVLTESHQPRHVYKGLGASYVIHSHGLNCEFLVTDDLIETAKGGSFHA
ncbi:hypothetical protein [Cohnella soli]|uniref:Uncharacterized protein n=1 Tax=Cohnella soli TaxID=425005 RepID=A0ABW0HT98_9BACL